MNCENCKFYSYNSNILGGIAECTQQIKPLSPFWSNNACKKHIKETKKVSKLHIGNLSIIK